MTPAKSRSWFTRVSKSTARTTGKPVTFVSACAIILVWALSGPLFHWSDTWQLRGKSAAWRWGLQFILPAEKPF